MSLHRFARGLAGAVAVMLLVPLTACGTNTSKGESSGAIPQGGTDDGTQISLWTRSGMERGAKNAVEIYNKSHKNQVKLQIIPADDMEGKVGVASQSDSLPDVLAGDIARIPYWSSEGIFKDITKQIDSLKNKSDLQQGHIDVGSIDGKEYTLPFVTEFSVIAWNKDLYKEAGLDPDKGPTSMKEFFEQAKKVASMGKEGVSGSYLPGQSGAALVFILFPSVWADGKEVMNKKGTEAELDNSTMKDVLEGYRELAQMPNGLGAGAKEETGATWAAPFNNGKVGIWECSDTSVSTALKAEKNGGFKVGVTAIPGTTSGKTSTLLGGDAMGITKDSKHAAQSWNFISWLMENESQKKVFADNEATASNIQTLKSAYKNVDERIQTMNSVVINGHGHTPKSVAFNAGFDAVGSPWQLLVQNAVWGKSNIQGDNAAVTKALSQN